LNRSSENITKYLMQKYKSLGYDIHNIKNIVSRESKNYFELFDKSDIVKILRTLNSQRLVKLKKLPFKLHIILTDSHKETSGKAIYIPIIDRFEIELPLRLFANENNMIEFFDHELVHIMQYLESRLKNNKALSQKIYNKFSDLLRVVYGNFSWSIFKIINRATLDDDNLERIKKAEIEANAVQEAIKIHKRALNLGHDVYIDLSNADNIRRFVNTLRADGHTKFRESTHNSARYSKLKDKYKKYQDMFFDILVKELIDLSRKKHGRDR
jgi:hypothetical protein